MVVHPHVFEERRPLCEPELLRSFCAGEHQGEVLNRGVRWHNGIHELQEASP